MKKVNVYYLNIVLYLFASRHFLSRHMDIFHTNVTLFRIKKNFNYANLYATTFSILSKLPQGSSRKTKSSPYPGSSVPAHTLTSIICHSLIHWLSWYGFSRGVGIGVLA